MPKYNALMMATHQEVAAILAKAAEHASHERACSRQAQAEEEAELLQTKRANARKRQAKCRAKRKQKEAFVAPMEHVPTMDMDTMSDYHARKSPQKQRMLPKKSRNVPIVWSITSKPDSRRLLWRTLEHMYH